MSTPSAKTLVIRHEACSSLGLLGPVAQQQQSIDYLNPFEGEVLTAPITDYSHLIMLGGAISAYEADRYPFLRYEFELIETAIENGIPTIGICLGAQILATVLGARVYRGGSGREAGSSCWRQQAAIGYFSSFRLSFACFSPIKTPSTFRLEPFAWRKAPNIPIKHFAMAIGSGRYNFI
jgi:GMP synthase-like glutamine amidotransferase